MKKKTTTQSNIKRITCVDCPQAASLIITEKACKACEFYKDGYCKYVLPAQPVKVVSQGTPMKFNRNFFQSMSDDIANTTRNYYLSTPIMEGVRNIPGYPQFTSLKKQFLAGEFKGKPEKKDKPKVKLKDPVLYMIACDNGKPDMIVEGKHYQATEDQFPLEGEWEVLYYLYNMLNLDGFADINIQNKWYKVKLSPIQDSLESYVAARKGKHLVIGRIKNEKDSIVNRNAAPGAV
jgi:hypothetical protein